MPQRIHRRIEPFLLFAAVAVAVALPRRGAAAEPAPTPEPPKGAVDGAPFAQLAGDEGTLVEVDLRPSVLRALARAGAAKGEPEARILEKLTSVRAVIVDLGLQRIEAAGELIEATAGGLRAKGWEELARIRDRAARIRVLLLPDGQRLAALTVLILQRSAEKGDGRGEAATSQLVFANITGQFDLADLGKLSGNLDIPGLGGALGSASASVDAGSKSAKLRGAGEAKAP